MVERLSRGQAFEAVLSGVISNHPVQGNGIVVVHPEDILSVGIEAQRSHKATRRCDALLRGNVRLFPVTDTGAGLITPCQAHQGWGRPTKSSIGIEYKDFGVNLIHNYEWHTTIVT